MRASLSLALLLTAALVGMHVPRSFTLLYVFSLLSVWLAVHLDQQIAKVFRRLYAFRVPLLILLLFSSAYVAGMLHWQLWTWRSDRLDIVNALILPVLLFSTGVAAVSWPQSLRIRVLLAYGIGGLVYVLLALWLARTPSWDLTQTFIEEIPVPWGSTGSMNVRSVEQNVFPSLLLLPAALLILLRPFREINISRILLFGVIWILAAHANWSLDGRMGWVVCALASLPVAVQIAGRLTPRMWSWMRRQPLLALPLLVSIGSLLIFFVASRLAANPNPELFCDERFALFSAMLARLDQAPWGGRLLRVPFVGCDSQVQYLLALHGGNILQAHNVLLDIYFNVGVIPSFLLLAFLAICCWRCRCWLVGLCRSPDWQSSMRWGWICLLTVQWLFQPLLYSDGLLYYLSFFCLGVFLAEAVCRSSYSSTSTFQSG